MTVPIRDLKRNYKINLALGRSLPTHDLAIPLPLSTGNPLYDAALTDKLVMTTTMSEPEHLNRAWHLVKNATTAEQQTLAQHAGGLLNDYKMLLALHAWQNGAEALTRQFLQALPWGWRFAFPSVAIKPATQLFTGWRRSLQFRLVDNPRYPALHQLFREVLAQAPGVAILKYRRTIKEAAALQRFRFVGDRERAIHDLCFNNGRQGLMQDDLEPIGTYLRARHSLSVENLPGFIRLLENSPHEIPLTSYMGLLGNAGIRLTDDYQPEVAALRHYAIRCATVVETLLRLNEWAEWLTESHVELLAQQVRHTIIERGLTIPFFKVIKAFINTPLRLRKMLLEPLLLPLLHHFGQQAAALLPAPGPLTFMQPGNVIHIMSFLLYSVLSSAMPTRLFLLYKEGLEELPPLDLNEVGHHLADDGPQFEQWLLAQFGGLSTYYDYTYDYGQMAKTLQTLDPAAPLVLDVPFAENMDVLAALLPFERVFNLNTTFGAPGEVCIAYEYYALFSMSSPYWQFNLWARYSDSAAQKFTEFLDRLHYFQRLAEAVRPGGAS